ncbi:MAG: hypothetical protein ACREOZ_00405 [Gloeomargaritales cyanobacterium]
MDKDIAISVGDYTPTEVKGTDEQDENQYFDRKENDMLSDGLIGAEVVLPHGEANEIARAIGRKHDSEGNLIGAQNTNPLSDTREYVITFPDGKEECHVMNTLAQALYSQIDEYGNKYYIFDDIIGHKRGKGGRGRTKGWLLEVLWNDGTTTWETLSSMKESHMVYVARYAVANQLEKEPAFSFGAACDA